ncbi:hypothetical protein [Candidatus Uabimicrobium sp. HlEnr_7]|uniref:hypothetical protein n=1 Tax=Candidatus Uabimicrobium helgolandensis TaxID=3095367 RepID=UPI003558621C
MKKCIVFVLLICILSPGCVLFELPGMLLQQVVPMVIQYAPYALMFIEETNERTIAENDLEKFYQDLHSNIPKSSDNLNELSFSVRKSLAQKNKKIQSVYVLNIKDISEEQLTHFFTKLSKKGKIHYKFVKINTLEYKEKITELQLQENIPIHTTQIATANLYNKQ